MVANDILVTSIEVGDIELARQVLILSSHFKYKIYYTNRSKLFTSLYSRNFKNLLLLFDETNEKHHFGHAILYHDVMMFLVKDSPRRALIFHNILSDKVLPLFDELPNDFKLVMLATLMRVYSKLGNFDVSAGFHKSFMNLLGIHRDRIRTTSFEKIRRIIEYVNSVTLADRCLVDPNPKDAIQEVRNRSIRVNRDDSILDEFELLVSYFCQVGDAETVELLAKDMETLAPRRYTHYYRLKNMLLAKVNASRPIGEIEGTMKQLMKYGAPKDAYDYLLKAYLRHGGITQYMQKRNEMLESGFLPSAETFNISLELFDGEAFDKELNLAQRYNAIDSNTIAIILNTIEKNIHGTPTNTTLERLQNTINFMNERRLNFTEKSIYTIMRIYYALKKYNLAVELFIDAFEHGDIDPDTEYANLALDCMAKEPFLTHYAYMQRLFQKMVYSATVDSFDLGKPLEGLKLRNHMLALDLEDDFKKILVRAGYLLNPRDLTIPIRLQDYYSKMIPDHKTFEIMSQVTYHPSLLEIMSKRPFFLDPSKVILENMFMLACRSQDERSAVKIYNLYIENFGPNEYLKSTITKHIDNLGLHEQYSYLF